jgi:hypothetical protein
MTNCATRAVLMIALLTLADCSSSGSSTNRSDGGADVTVPDGGGGNDVLASDAIDESSLSDGGCLARGAICNPNGQPCCSGQCVPFVAPPDAAAPPPMCF